MSVSFRSVSIISVKKAFDWGERPASQSEHLCRTNANLSDKGTARCFLAKTKIRGGKFFVKTLKSLRYGLRGRVFPGAILQPCGRKNKPSVRTGAVWSGHRNRGISVGCILQHERSVFLFRSLSRYTPHETGNGILNGLKHKTKHTCFTTAKRTINLKNVTPWIH